MTQDGTTADGSRPALAPLVDTHTHLFLMEDDPATVVRDAVAAGIVRMVCAGIDPESARTSIALAEAHPEVFATAGMHPHTASALDAGAKGAIEELLAHPRVVAVGEAGLDYYRNLSPAEEQRAAFRWQIGLSNERGLPIVVHIREAWDDALAILADERAERVVLHCFSGDVDQANECVARGYVLSFAANVTYPKNRHLLEAAAAVPQDRLVVETDSPFLPPEGRRGRENVPANARVAADAIAAARGEDPADLATALTATARAVFGLPD